MRIAVISNTDSFIPFAYTLISQGISVHLFFSPSADPFVNQKVKAFAEQSRIAFTEEKNTGKDLYQWLQNGQYDVCFMLGYAHLINLDKLKNCTTKLYNIHFGSLPSFRGPVPVFWQLKQGADNIGVTIHEVSEKFDAGKIVWIKETPNLPHYNYELVNQLFGQLCVEGVIYLLRFLMNQLPPPVIDRNQFPMAYHKRPGLTDVSIDWNTMNAAMICNLVRACNPWNKGAATSFKGRELKLIDAQVIGDAATVSGSPVAGTIVNDAQCLHVICCDGKILEIHMAFFENFYMPAYQGALFGFLKGGKLG